MVLLLCWRYVEHCFPLEVSRCKYSFFKFVALLVFTAYPITWKHRKMGATWDLEGVPNYDFVVQNAGGVLLIYGIVLFWIGSNAIIPVRNSNAKVLPIYNNYRALAVASSILFILVPSSMALEYAFDEGSQSLGYYLDGSSFIKLAKKMTLLTGEPFARSIETPFFYVFGWLLLAFEFFLPLSNGFTFQRLFAMLFCMAIAIVDSVFVNPAFWNADSDLHYKWEHVSSGLMVLLAMSLGFSGANSRLAMGVLGVILIFAGNKMYMEDRKRGKSWLQEQRINTSSTAFGLGQPIRTVGWIMLAIASSAPM